MGEEFIVQVVTNNASNNVSASRSLAVRRPCVFWTSCAAHLNVLLQDIIKINPRQNAILMARTARVYLYAHTIVRDMMREKIEGPL